jgi:hypothetical protein
MASRKLAHLLLKSGDFQMVHSDKPGNRKAAYTSPRLEKYGTVSELTQAGAGNQPDGLGGSDQVFSDTLPDTGIN